ncbi:uncharacterized protein F5Z01DRAFT_162955 [Emericellopsis atlantica]|uniref:Uncharacterized protein n=1 Tax=Emericellopsis atlantica TaxID=2614577 RepID=A0A9P7ZKT9_9HYPO|nr:uncharacterized protein F5Z01DRAFT_162955 [Emericellopsis atlantica]KAG9253323.1 hypothetical protein F5Z01DRAFT_162955 [Emericellopsis atlantica]
MSPLSIQQSLARRAGRAFPFIQQRGARQSAPCSCISIMRKTACVPWRTSESFLVPSDYKCTYLTSPHSTSSNLISYRQPNQALPNTHNMEEDLPYDPPQIDAVLTLHWQNYQYSGHIARYFYALLIRKTRELYRASHVPINQATDAPKGNVFFRLPFIRMVPWILLTLFSTTFIIISEHIVMPILGVFSEVPLLIWPFLSGLFASLSTVSHAHAVILTMFVIVVLDTCMTRTTIAGQFRAGGLTLFTSMCIRTFITYNWSIIRRSMPLIFLFHRLRLHYALWYFDQIACRIWDIASGDGEELFDNVSLYLDPPSPFESPSPSSVSSFSPERYSPPRRARRWSGACPPSPSLTEVRSQYSPPVVDHRSRPRIHFDATADPPTDRKRPYRLTVRTTPQAPKQRASCGPPRSCAQMSPADPSVEFSRVIHWLRDELSEKGT